MIKSEKRAMRVFWWLKRATPFQPPMSASLTQKKPQFNTSVSSTSKTLHFDTPLSSTRPSVQHTRQFWTDGCVELRDVSKWRVFGVELTVFSVMNWRLNWGVCWTQGFSVFNWRETPDVHDNHSLDLTSDPPPFGLEVLRSLFQPWVMSKQ